MHLVATDGWKLLGQYEFSTATGLWLHRHGVDEPPMSLDEVRYCETGIEYPKRRRHEPESRLADYLAQAEALFAAPPAAPPPAKLDVSADFEHLRWFPLPGDSAAPATG